MGKFFLGMFAGIAALVGAALAADHFGYCPCSTGVLLECQELIDELQEAEAAKETTETEVAKEITEESFSSNS